MFIDMLGAAFHLWFGSFIGMQTMKTRAVFNKVGGHSCAKVAIVIVAIAMISH